MNICNDRHMPIYKITYKGFKGSKYTHEWLVCKICMENKLCFSNEEDILKMVQVNESTMFNF